MKWLLMFACAVLVGCGVIFGVAHTVVPHLVVPDLLPSGQAREPARAPVEKTLAKAGVAVTAGLAAREESVAAR